MNRKTVIAIALSATFAAPVFGQSAGRGLEAKDTNPAAPSAGATAGGFAAMDRNNDGYLSRDEAKDAVWNTRFTELDTDNDGRLSQSEFEALGGTGTGGAGATGRPGGDKPADKR